MGRLRRGIPVHERAHGEAQLDSAFGEGRGEHGPALPLERLHPDGQQLQEADGESHCAAGEVRHSSADHWRAAVARTAHSGARSGSEHLGEGREGGREEYPSAGEGAAAVPEGGRGGCAEVGEGRGVGDRDSGREAARSAAEDGSLGKILEPQLYYFLFDND